MIPQFIEKDLTQIDVEHVFLHYTNKNNLDNIIEKGLEPRIGENSLYVEKSKKIFFVEGINGLLMIMDVWLKWLTSKCNVNKGIYCLGTFYMKLPFCIKSIPNNIVKKNLEDETKRYKVYLKMKKILDDSVFLVLKLEENVDFSYCDIDEVKSTFYDSFLKLLYPKDSNFKDKTMEYWNMHTYSNKIIEPNKISILKNNNSYSASEILKYLIENNMNYVQSHCEFLYDYYQKIYC